MYIVQEVVDGEPKTPRLFVTAQKARKLFHDIVKECGYSPMGVDNVSQHEFVLKQAGDVVAFENDGENTLVTLYEVDNPT